MSATLEQQRDLSSKRVASEESDHDVRQNKSDAANGVNSRDGTSDQRRRSPSSATQEAASTLVQMSNTRPLIKKNSQSPKKSSTPVSQKREESTEKFTDKCNEVEPLKKQKTIDNEETSSLNNSKKREGGVFRTDREYLDGNKEATEDFVEWHPDPEHPFDSENDAVEERGKGGWAPDEMFRTNYELGVYSTYNGIDEYSNVEPEGDEEARREADRIACEIEQNKESLKYVMLENDDEERDLDKETHFGDGTRKKQSGGYQNKGNRSQFSGGGGSGTNRNYSNSPRNSYPSTGSGSSSSNVGSNRYSTQSRQQRSYPSSFSSSSAPSRQSAPMATSWRNSSPQQHIIQPLSSTCVRPTTKSPIHLDERHQSASPASQKYSPDAASTHRTNSVQNRQQTSYSPRTDYGQQQQTDKRIPDVRYHDGPPSTPPATSLSVQQGEIPPLITPIPKQPPTPQQSHTHTPVSYDSQPAGVLSDKDDEDKQKKAFKFNPDAQVFVPKSQSVPSTTPTAVQIQPVPMASVSHYGQQAMPMAAFPVQQMGGIQQPLVIAQQAMFQQAQMPAMQTMPQAVAINMQPRSYQQLEGVNYADNVKLMEQKYMAAPMQMAHRVPHVQYVQHPQYPQQLQMQSSLTHPQFNTGQVSYTQTGIVSAGLPYAASSLIQQQPQVIYQYGGGNFTSGQ